MVPLSVELKNFQQQVCGIRDQEIGSLVSYQNKRPFALAIIEYADHSNKYFDARELTHKFSAGKEIADPITKETSIKVYYLWNLIARNTFTEFGRIETKANEFLSEANLQKLSDVSAACLEPDIAKRIHAQIRTALRYINYEQDQKNESLDKLIALIYDEIITEFINIKYVYMSDYKKSLQELYKRTQDNRLAACLCLDEIETSFIDEELDSILQKDPGNVLALTIKGLRHRREDCFVEQKDQVARVCFERAICLRNDNLQAWKNLLEISMERATVLIRQELLKEPENPILLTFSAHVVLKNSKENQGDNLKQAKELIEKALKIDSRCLLAYFCLANILGANTNSLNEQEQAVQYLHKIIEIDPRNEKAYKRLGDCFYYGIFGVQPDHNQAYEYYKKAVEFNPNSSSCELLGRLLISGNGVKKNIEKALFYLDKALHMPARASAINSLLGAIFFEGMESLKPNFKKSHEHLQKSIELDPGCDISHMYLGLLMMNGFDEEPMNQKLAYEYLTKALSLGCKDPRCYYHLGELLRTGGVGIECDLFNAEKYLLKALETTTISSISPLVHRSLGLLYRTRLRSPLANLTLPNIGKAYIHFKKYYEISRDTLSLTYYCNFLIEEEWGYFPQDELRNLYEMAADNLQKNHESAVALAYHGELYRIGIEGFLDKNPSKAHEFFMKSLSSNQNNIFALSRIGALLIEGGQGLAVDLKQASCYLKRALVLCPNQRYVTSKLNIIEQILQA